METGEGILKKRKSKAIYKWSATLCFVLLAIEWFNGSFSFLGMVVTMICVVPLVHIGYILMFGFDAFKANQLNIRVKQDQQQKEGM